MINYDFNYVETHTIGDAWREVMLLCLKNGYDYKIEGGSYIGQIRKQLSHVCIRIKEPWLRPLAPIPPSSVPPPTTDDKIFEYYNEYLLNPVLLPGEQYRYSSYISPQLNDVAQLLVTSSGNTNQGCISVGGIDSTKLEDPPCLRVLSYKVINGQLQCTVFFRSWDLFAGMPQNLGGIQLLKEYLIGLCSIISDGKVEFKDGPLVCFSDGGHLYEMYDPYVKLLNYI